MLHLWPLVVARDVSIMSQRAAMLCVRRRRALWTPAARRAPYRSRSWSRATNRQCAVRSDSSNFECDLATLASQITALKTLTGLADECMIVCKFATSLLASSAADLDVRCWQVYEETLEDNGRFNEQPALPFNAYGTMALARSEFETNSGSSQFFFLLKVTSSRRIDFFAGEKMEKALLSHLFLLHDLALSRPISSARCIKRLYQRLEDSVT